jgi:amino acid transporter
MKPWKRLDRASIRLILIWTGLWVLLMASRMPTFYSMEKEGYQFVIKDTEIYTMAALNLPVILWVILLTRGEFWLTRPRALRWISPLLTLVMTLATIYLFIACQPNGPAIVDVFGVKYQYLIGEFRNHRM